MNWTDTWGTIADIVTALAAILAALVAVPGINAWKTEVTTKTEYELARRCLRSIYKVRDMIAVVRNPFIPVGEMIEALRKQGLDEDAISNRDKTNRAVYSSRWQKLSDALSDMDVELREAEVIWGDALSKLVKPLDQHIRKLRAHVMMFLDNNRTVTNIDDIIYDSGEGDSFNIETNSYVKKIEDYLRPYLNLRHKRRYLYRI